MLNKEIDIYCLATYQTDKSSPENNTFIFSYTIKISNNSNQNVSLLTRHWLITDGNAQVREVHGHGVLGQQPLILPGKYFTYTSYAVLDTAIGFMEGKYKMSRSDGSVFDAHIQKFNLIQQNAVH